MSHPTLQRGDTGEDVSYLQERLQLHLGSAGIELSLVDGDFGPITEASVRYLQQQHGLSDDGVVGDGTWAVLEQDPSGGSAAPGPSSTPGIKPLDLSIPWRLRLRWDEVSLNDINLQLSNFDLRTHPSASLEFLQPVGRLFGAGGIEVLNLELRTWPNWFLNWSVEGTLNWSRDHGIEIGADNELELGIRPLRGVELKATGNLDLRWRPMDGTGSVEPSGSIMLNLDILELIR